MHSIANCEQHLPKQSKENKQHGSAKREEKTETRVVDKDRKLMNQV